jgi:hypothetical protein
MPKINLDQQYLWAGTYYGPGETQVPDEFAQAYNLVPLAKAKPRSKASDEAPATEEKA